MATSPTSLFNGYTSLPTTNNTGASGGQWAINQAIPGLSGLTQSATGIISNALSGLPSPSESRLANAYLGAQSGLDPTSDFLRNRGFDLYRTQANQRQQQGLGNLFNLIGTYSGNVAPTPGQELQDQQAQAQNRLGQQQLQQQGSQFQQGFDFEQQQWQKQLELLNQYLGDPAGGVGSNPLAPGAGGQNIDQRYYAPWSTAPAGTNWYPETSYTRTIG